MYKVYSKKLDHAFYLTDEKLTELFNGYAKLNIDKALESKDQYSYAGHIFMSVSEDDKAYEDLDLGLKIVGHCWQQSQQSQQFYRGVAEDIQALIKEHMKQGFRL